MPDPKAFDLSQLIDSPVGRIGVAVCVGLVVIVILRTLWSWIRGPKQQADADSPLAIRLDAVSETTPESPVRVRNIPASLAAVVLAPVGKSSEAVTVESIPALADRFVPGLSQVIERQAPQVKLWPRQVSHTGFGHALIKNVQIPDAEWRGSRWCVVSGPAILGEQRFDLGLVVAFGSPNSMDLIKLEDSAEWPGVVQVDGSQS